MKSIRTLIVIFLVALSHICSSMERERTDLDPVNQKAVTYIRAPRLGNALIAYCHAKWIAYKYHLPLLYLPFDNSEYFKLYEIEQLTYSQWGSKFKNLVSLNNEKDIINLPSSTIIKVEYFRDDGYTATDGRKKPFLTDWKNPEFLTILRTALQPRVPIETIEICPDKVNVLVHVRTGGGFDSRETQLRFPFKFPPNLFYISSIQILSEYLGHPQIYAFILTDDQNPEKIAQEFRAALTHLPNIEFNYRKGKAGPSVNIIEDFFSIPKFDCLIRADSTFAIMASLLTDFKIIIYPEKAHVDNDEVFIDEIRMVSQSEKK